MTQISYAPYQLKPSKNLNAKTLTRQPRQGMLLKIQKNKSVGYSDVHPWPELGDLPLEEHLVALIQKNPTFLTRVSLSQAQRDAEARSKNKSLLLLEPLLKNNFVASEIDELTDLKLERLKKLKFQVIKLKAGVDLEKELFFSKKILGTGNFGLRLDFNSVLEWADFQKFFEAIPTKYIEYAEDPLPYSVEVWTEARKFLPVALDFEAKKLSWEKHRPPTADILIVKPLRMNMEVITACIEAWPIDFTVTSAMDHPLGMLQAYTWAQELALRFPDQHRAPGCLTLDSYEPNAYQDEVLVEGPLIKSINGRGSGFKKLLEGESWIPLS